MHEVRDLAAAAGSCDVFPVGAITKGLLGESLAEMGEMVEAGVRVFSDDGRCVPTARLLRNALIYAKAFPVEVVLADHAEDASLVEGGHMHEGLQSASLGLAGRPAEAEEIAVARDLALARATGGRLHLCHLSSARAVELVRRAKAEGVRVTAEVTPHHLVFTDADLATYDTAKKMNPPLRAAGGSRRAARRSCRRDDRCDRDRPRTPRGRGEGHGVRPRAAGDDRPGDRARGGAHVPRRARRPLPVAGDRGAVDDPGSHPRRDGARRADRGRAPRQPGGVRSRSEDWIVEPPFVSKARNSAFTGARLRGRVRFTMLGGALTVADGKPTR